MEYLYAITVSYDGNAPHWTGRYSDALTAVNEYNKSLPLHPDDLWAVDHTGQIMGIIQEVEFDMVEVLTVVALKLS